MKLRFVLILISVLAFAVLMLTFIIPLKNKLSDCQFECNHLQAKIDRLEELSDVIEAMNQVLPPLVLAQFKVIDKMIKDKKYREYERYEQPLLTEKEKNQ